VVDAVDNDIDLSDIEQIAKRRPATGDHISETCFAFAWIMLTQLIKLLNQSS
jgi:hypothetical protein